MNMPILKYINDTDRPKSRSRSQLTANSTILQLIKFNAPSKMDYITNYSPQPKSSL